MNHEQDDNFELSDLSLEVAAAEVAVALAEGDPAPDMPATLRARLHDLATEHIAAMRARSQEASASSMKFARIPSLPPTLGQALAAEARGVIDAFPLIPAQWQPFVRTFAGIAAAACIVIGLVIFQYSLSQSPSARREAMMAQVGSSSDVVHWSWNAWTAQADARAATATGDVVWNTQSQGGFMTFTGLPAIDPSKEVYQLWIIDADRPGEHPVDGGTFVVTSDRETIVPFQARVKVGKPIAFAVTIEKPGGVVVSDQKRKLTIAAPPKS